MYMRYIDIRITVVFRIARNAVENDMLSIEGLFCTLV